MRGRGEHGTSILEVLVAAAIVTLMALAGLGACKAIAGVTAAGLRSGHDAAAIEAETNRLRADAAAAFAIFVPAADMNGGLNAGRQGGHEVDFYARADDGRPVFWRYYYDAAARTLQRFDYDPAGASGVRDVATGAIDTAASYPALAGVTAFAAQTVRADQLGDPAVNRYAGVSSLLARRPDAYAVAFERPGLGLAPASGGNAVVQVTLANGAAARTVHLTAAVRPGGFTVTGAPRWHAVVYRVDQTHRFLFGFAGKSHVFIDARIEVSYDGWQTRTTWCDFNLLGNPDGLDPHDPHADYKPNEPVEQAESILARCRALRPTPPPRDSAGNPAEPGIAVPAPGPTPPACWTNPGPQGRCWPDGVPADWFPAGRLPPEPPPASWCATHAASVACAPRTGVIGASR